MYFNTDLGFSERLPVFHIFFPTTFAQRVSNFLEERGIDSCFVVGQTELRVLKPVRRPRSPPPVGKSPLSFINEVGIRTRSKSRSKNKRRKSGGDGDDSSSRTTTTSSPPPSPFKTEESYQQPQPSSSSKEEEECSTFAVNILGITDNLHNFQGGDSVNSLQIIGRCSKPTSKSSSTSRANSTLFLDLNLEKNGDNLSSFSVEIDYPKIFWKESPPPDPLTIITILHTRLPQIPQDHQDLNLCNTAPSFITSSPLHSFISKKSSGLEQITHKVSILVLGLLGNYPLFPLLNFIFLLLLDSLFGYLITSYLLQFPNLLGFLHEAVDQMLFYLNHLLKWLHGAPAGLKLNHNLNSLYWRFFSYHIHLWASYIGILEPVFAVILNTIQYLGGLGITIQISLLKDLINLATFHVYCLYIYATRLYSIQTTAIVFFGRKYSHLRNRFDSVQLNTSELFISSFGFVILIFLFPTTMVYYAGFVCVIYK
ncbi:Phosphatidylinositol N-acetylglucosaminyltransferase subunit Q [Orchesella cincta]|uniref:Phosphatidylinositol N-acetylglucosaminyltransferase subunit Q n=1 Tax=Orchesella cincta TaxID=48709 RepID=A0A1D2MIF1_ORCCI|nr:Phosphatidylinositol N-acetylglucosaminyltransferase subunit Q [Orchesella cincta]